MMNSKVRMGKLPVRSKRFGVGKEIGGAIYVHRMYDSLLPRIVQRCKNKIDHYFNFTVVKYAEKAETVSFISCADFDTVAEPAVGNLVTVKFDGTVKQRKQLSDPYIYHHKWLFVRDDYGGFSVEESKERSRLWLSLSDVDMRRIGRKSYWQAHVVPRLSDDQDLWLSSTEMATHLKVSSCELSHLRLAGKLLFRKQGNSFFYRVDSEPW